MTQAATPARHPRLFWRRFAALIVDGFLFLLLASLVTAAVTLAVPSLRPALSAPVFSLKSCEPAETDIAVFRELESVWTSSVDDPPALVLCTIDGLFMQQKRVALIAGEDTMASGQPYIKSIAVQLDADGNPIFPSPLIEKVVSAAEMLLFPLALALAGILFGATPGKRLMRILVAEGPLRTASSAPSEKTAIMREYLKFWPVCIFAILSVVLAAQMPNPTSIAEAASMLESFDPDLRILTHTFVLGGTTLLLLFGWWIWPFMIWRSRTWYDAFLGTAVIMRD
ncbi:RDD family protein [Martelella limonii]|uniref:RDD family protein n=1 Tax=Martelella limonii TaxID=1647649 RepID=UPI00157FFB50|nr:RDD family protein [Martelella limonii]